jgi:hypothetical protein
MDATSQQKVIAAGFTIIRANSILDYKRVIEVGFCFIHRIRIKNAQHRKWATLEKFETKAARDRRMRELLASLIIITD